MTEPENFEDDLFADLYAEDDTAPKPAVSVPDVKAEPSADIELKVEDTHEQYDQNGGADEQMYTGDQDVDDDINFNLGGNSNGNGNGNGNSYEAQPHHEAHGPGIKEDG